MRKITFQTDKNQNSFIFSVDHIQFDIFDHKYCIDPGNLFSIKSRLLKYQYLAQVFLNFKEAW